MNYYIYFENPFRFKMMPAKRDDPLRELIYEPKYTTWRFLVSVDIPAGMIWPTIVIPAAEQGGKPTLYDLEPTYMNRDWALMFRILRIELTWELILLSDNDIIASNRRLHRV